MKNGQIFFHQNMARGWSRRSSGAIAHKVNLRRRMEKQATQHVEGYFFLHSSLSSATGSWWLKIYAAGGIRTTDQRRRRELINQLRRNLCNVTASTPHCFNYFTWLWRLEQGFAVEINLLIKFCTRGIQWLHERLNLSKFALLCKKTAMIKKFSNTFLQNSLTRKKEVGLSSDF